MGELYIVRHGKADRRLDDKFGEHVLMNSVGEMQIRTAGSVLGQLFSWRGTKVTTIECATSARSKHNAKLLGGTMGEAARIIPNTLLDQEATVGSDVLLKNIEQWTQDRETGLYLAVMSGRAIQAYLAHAGEPNVFIDDNENHYVPCGSVTKIIYAAGGSAIDFVGQDPRDITVK